MDNETQNGYSGGEDKNEEYQEVEFRQVESTESPIYNSSTEDGSQIHSEMDKKENNMGLASLVMGIIGIVTTCCCYGGIIFGSLGIIFAILSRINKKFEGYAVPGLITSIIALVLSIILIIMTVVLAFSGVMASYEYYY